MKNLKKVTITRRNLEKFAGVRRFRYGEAEQKDLVGVVTGLAWTEVGGSILTTEVQVLDGKGKLTVTGQLGDVMQESAQAALAYVRSRAHQLGLSREFYRNVDIHLHVPEGAIPKDGPSAGVAMLTSIVSVLTGTAVRRDVAMTGEITLRGRVLPIGGLKEKLLAAHRGGIKTVLIPEENVKDLAEIPENIKNRLDIHPVKWIDQVLEMALERKPEALPEPAEPAPIPPGPPMLLPVPPVPAARSSRIGRMPNGERMCAAIWTWSSRPFAQAAL